MNWKDHITTDPNALVGKPVIKGTRLSVDLILERLADGWTREDLFDSYPTLTEDRLQAVFAMAAELIKEEQFVVRSKLPA